MLEISRKEREYIKYQWRRAQEYIKYLEREEERVFSAKRLGLKECQRCGFCCINVICVPRPDEMEAIAKFLGLTSTELARKYMVIDKFITTNYFLRFAREGQEDITGICLTTERMFDRGYCILFDKESKACRIYPVRPLEAREWNCWDAKPSYFYTHGAKSAWGRDDIYEFVPGFRSGG